MKSQFFISLSLLFMLIAPAQLSAYDMPFQYMRDTITIARQPAIKLPWHDLEDAQPQAPLPMSVEIRNAGTLFEQKDWFTLAPPKINEGVLLVYDTPTHANISKANHYAPLDILLIGSQGVVYDILPSVRLSSIKTPITSQEKLKAIMLLKDGASETLKIRAGDEIIHQLFASKGWTPPREDSAVEQYQLEEKQVLILEDAPRKASPFIEESESTIEIQDMR